MAEIGNLRESGGKYVFPWPCPAVSQNASQAGAANTAAQVVLAAHTLGPHYLSSLVWSYSGSPTGGRLSVTAQSAGLLLDVDVAAAGPGQLDFFPPLQLGGRSEAVTIALAAAGAAVTGKVNVTCWVMP